MEDAGYNLPLSASLETSFSSGLEYQVQSSHIWGSALVSCIAPSSHFALKFFTGL